MPKNYLRPALFAVAGMLGLAASIYIEAPVLGALGTESLVMGSAWMVIETFRGPSREQHLRTAPMADIRSAIPEAEAFLQ